MINEHQRSQKIDKTWYTIRTWGKLALVYLVCKRKGQASSLQIAWKHVLHISESESNFHSRVRFSFHSENREEVDARGRSLVETDWLETSCHWFGILLFHRKSPWNDWIQASSYDELSATLRRKKSHTILKIHSSSEFLAALGGPTSWASERHSEGKRWKGETRAPTPWFRSGAPYIAVHGPPMGFEDLGCPSCIHVQVGTSLVGIKCLGLRRKTWELANSRKTPLKSALSTQCWPTHTASKGHSSPSWYAQLDCLNAMHRNRAKSCWDLTILGCPAHDNTLMWHLMHASFAWKPTWTFAGITRLLWSKFVLDRNDCFWFLAWSNPIKTRNCNDL